MGQRFPGRAETREACMDGGQAERMKVERWVMTVEREGRKWRGGIIF